MTCHQLPVSWRGAPWAVALWLCVVPAVGAQPRTVPDQTAGAPAVPLSQLEADADKHPGDPRPLVLLGLAYWDQNDFPRALETFARAVKVGPKSAEAHNWLGVALSGKADLPGAIAAFRTAIALDPQYGRAYSNLGSALAQSGDFAEAVRVFEKALVLEPNSLGAQLNLGMALRETGDLDGALVHLRSVVAADPDNAGIQFELGQTLRQSGDFAGAVTALERAIAVNPELREGYYALGTTLKQQAASMRKPGLPAPSPGDDLYQRAQDAAARGDLKAARDQLTEALRHDDRHAGAHTTLGFILGQQGDLTSARAHLERAIALRPDSSDAHYNLGVALWYGGVKDKALEHLGQSVRLDPAAGASHAFLGVALREQGDLPAAAVSLQRAIALMPPTAAVYIDLGITFVRAGELDRAVGQFEAGLNLPPPSVPTPDWDSAIAGLRQALASHPDRPDAHNVLGLLLGRRGAVSGEVAAQFREAIRLRPDYAQAHNNLGLVLLQAGDDPAALAAFREAVRISPEYADARINLGAALTPTDADAAIVELEKAVALAPASVKAHFNLALAYGSSSKGGQAREVEQLRKVIALAPAFPRARLALGKALLRDGTVAEAIAELLEATRLEPESGEAHYQLGLALARAGRKEEAAAALQKGRALVAAGDREQNAALDLAEGQAALGRGDLEEAASRFRRAAEARPESTEARRGLAAVAERKAAAQSEANTVDDPARVADFESYIREGRFVDVEPLLADYVTERPSSSWGWYALGYSRFAQQKIGESIKALARSLELDIRNVEAHKILGRNLMIIGRFDAAQIEFEQGLRYKPDSAELHYNLGRLFSIQDNWEPARKALEAAVQIDPSYVEALDALGFAMEALGDDAGAIANYQKAIAINDQRKGGFANAHVNLSAYYNRTGHPDKAREHADLALALDPKSDRAWFQKGRADERQDQLDAAVDALNRAIALNPRASSYYYVLSGVYRRLDWMDESRKALEAFKRLDRESNELDKKRRAAIAGAPGTPDPK